MIKKLLSIILSGLMLASLFGCSGEKEADERMKIVATNFALYDFAKNVCGDLCSVTMLIPAGTESHDFEATLGDIDKIASSDLFIHTGGESEEWIDDVFSSLESMDIQINSVSAVEYVETYEEELKEGMQAEEEDDDGVIDEHVWTSIPNAVLLIDVIAEKIIEIEPSFEAEVKENAENYKTELMKIDNEIEECVMEAKRNLIIVADRFPFRYFTERYSLEYYAAFSGCTSNTEPTLSTINFLIEKVREENIPAVFKIEFSDGKCAEAIAKETGCAVLELHSAHNVTKEELDGGITYADIMRRNLEQLKTALN